MSGEQAYSALLDARVEHVPGVSGLLAKEKLGGKSVISHSLDRFDEDDRCTEVLLLAGAGTREWIAGDPLTFASVKLKLLPVGAGLAEALALAREPGVVYHDAARPNWQTAVLDALLRAWQPGRAIAPAAELGTPLAQTSTDPALRAVELLETTTLRLVETPQVFDAGALAAAFAAHPEAEAPAAAILAAGIQLDLVAARALNLPVRHGDDLHLLRRLLGEPKKASKDRYGGLGW